MSSSDRDSLSALVQRLESELEDSQRCMQKIKRDWRGVRTTVDLDPDLHTSALSSEVSTTLSQLRDSFAKECSSQTQELATLQTDIYVDSLWVTERLEELADLQRREARLRKTVGE